MLRFGLVPGRSNKLLNGFHIVAVVGLFANSEMAAQMLGRDLLQKRDVKVARPGLHSVALTLKHYINLIRSSAIGKVFGAIPAAGGVISSFTSYAVAKSATRPEEKFGEGSEGGGVATETANNSTVGGTLVPTLSLGIPGDAASAMFLGTLLIPGFIPGPAMFENNPYVVGGIFMVHLASNVFLLFAGILATQLFVYILRIPKVYLTPSIMLLCSIGTFALQASVFDLQIMLDFGLIGILFRTVDCPLAPTVIRMILDPILEDNLRRSPLISSEGYWIFLDRPVSASLAVVNAPLLMAMVYISLTRARSSKQSESVKVMTVDE